MFDLFVVKTTERISNISKIALIIILFMISIDIVSVKLLGWSITGLKSYVEVLMIAVVFFTVPYITADSEHISVNIINFSDKVSHIMEILHYILGILLTGFFTWRTFAFAQKAILNHQIVTGTEGSINIPLWPLALIVVFGFAITVFIYVLQFVKTIGLLGGKKPKL